MCLLNDKKKRSKYLVVGLSALKNFPFNESHAIKDTKIK